MAWEDLTLECSASLSQADGVTIAAEASADEDADGVEYGDEEEEDGMSKGTTVQGDSGGRLPRFVGPSFCAFYSQAVSA